MKYSFIAFLFLLSIFLIIFSGISEKNLINRKEAERIAEAKKLHRINQLNPHLTASSTFSIYIEDPTETASSSLGLKVQPQTVVLYSKNENEKRPIASLSKLLTALVASQNIATSSIIKITDKAISQYGIAGGLFKDEVYTRDQLLHATLIESSNDAAFALAESLGDENFIGLMNKYAATIGMKNSLFNNPTGLDELGQAANMQSAAGSSLSATTTNISTTYDLYLLSNYILKNEPIVFNITTKQGYILNNKLAGTSHTLNSTNKLLSDPDFPLFIRGGKTGDTDSAKQTLLVVTDAPNKKGYIISIILRSDSRFDDMKKLYEWIIKSYDWDKSLAASMPK